MYDFKTFQFGAGKHSTRESGMCIMEAVAYVAGEPHSDMPACACPVISLFIQGLNDGIADAERGKMLGPYVWRLPGTRCVELETQRLAVLLSQILWWLDKKRRWAEIMQYDEDAEFFTEMYDSIKSYTGSPRLAAVCGMTMAFVANRLNCWEEVTPILDRLIRMTEIQEPGFTSKQEARLV